MKNRIAKSPLILALVLTALFVAMQFIAASATELGYDTTALLGAIEYNSQDFIVELNQSAPEVKDYYAYPWSKSVYQGRNVPLDEGKTGVLITSKQSGSAVNGKSFMLGGTMSGEFSVDFRLLSERNFVKMASGEIANPYADVQKIVFTFTDVSTKESFDVVITAGGKSEQEKNIPEMYIVLPDGSYHGHRYGDMDYTLAEDDWLGDPDKTYYTRLDGTSFANTAEQVKSGGFTYGAKSTSFSFDPASMQVNAARYYRDGTLGQGNYADISGYVSELTGTVQEVDGRNMLLRNDHLLVLDLDDEVTGDNALSGFERYTVKVTFAEVTPDETEITDDEVTALSYARYAKMYIYSLNGKNLVGEEIVEPSGDIFQGEYYTAPEGSDNNCLLSFAKLNLQDYDFWEIDEFGVILSGYEKSYKYRFDTENKTVSEDGEYGVAIYGLRSGDYLLTSYVVYDGKLITTGAKQVRYIAQGEYARLAISCEEKTLTVGDNAMLNVNIFDKDVEWISSDDNVVSFERQADMAYAEITAKGVGEAIVSAEVDGAVVECKVTVKSSMLVDIPFQNALTLDCDEGLTKQLEVKVHGAGSKVLTYKSMNTQIAEVDENGVITAKKGGTCDIVVTNEESGESATVALTVKHFPLPDHVYSGEYDLYHVQGICFDEDNQYLYYTFTNIFVKTDVYGNLIGTMTGYPGHLGDCTFNERDGRVYASLTLSNGEYDWYGEDMYYIAIIDVDKINEAGMSYETENLMKVVQLSNVAAYAKEDTDGDGIADGKFGIDGIDGCEMGPKFGVSDGKEYLTVSACIPKNLARTDNDYQVLWQYDITGWWSKVAKPLDTQNLPAQTVTPDGEYFLLTGNGEYGIQDIAYDEYTKCWYFVTYEILRPNYAADAFCFVVAAESAPVSGTLTGQPDQTQGMLLSTVKNGLNNGLNDIYYYNFWEACTGLVSLGNGYFYVSESGTNASGKQFTNVYKYKWTGEAPKGFEKI